MHAHKRLRGFAAKAVEFRHRLRLWWSGRGHEKVYRDYLRLQLDRSLLKRTRQPKLRTQLLIEQVAASNGVAGATVLCIGSRDGDELECFRRQGFAHVLGIDLFSERPDILAMDMHKLKFPDDRFDIVYACHSLEHAYDAAVVTGEIVRVARQGALVAIEVPIQYTTTDADRIDFGNLDGLLRLFKGHVGTVLWSEIQPPLTPRNESGTAILRTVFSVSKSRPSAAARGLANAGAAQRDRPR
jgi:SAM-dependent methyltransferase